MALLNPLGPDTIRRLDGAAAQRFKEADAFRDAKFNLTAIYLYGYVAEMLIGAAFFRLLGYGATQEIEPDRRRTVLHQARQLSKMEEESKAHPLDGLARLLVQDREAIAGKGYEPRFRGMIEYQADRICEYWGPRLRYRAFDMRRNSLDSVRSAANWFRRYYDKLQREV